MTNIENILSAVIDKTVVDKKTGLNHIFLIHNVMNYIFRSKTVWESQCY